ncbi:MAG: helix-hairpin-helix domain-containing protein [Sphingobacteriales bacterium]|jgi:competence protein ComEA|nr:helix-hairpin-helix domain-containing protein [Sphingobacteriales bacterium]MBK7527042.1 helix-hairpin-helix domain-containing protein [Sphingobacteriales bacterium]MBP9141489.1 helix-hairpin-helix domain-containing protein [Chitinophagales bacterium]MCC7055805.1 helix-hairpin-helix domain-containing protein [Chitinophagales bacterium]MDA0198074.1 helix-hairpin-helix domain-containing protein [Bacteroidota bacterium]
MGFKQKIDSLFVHASRADRRVIIFLLCLCVVLMAAPTIMYYVYKPQNFNTEQLAQLSQLHQNLTTTADSPNTNNHVSTVAAITDLAQFNPNELNYSAALALGLPPNVASNLAKYLATGARFKKPEDVKRIYGLSNADYERLLPYMVFPEEDIAENEATISGLRDKNKPNDSRFYPDKTENSNGKNYKIQARPFDPNNLTYNEALALGLPSTVANNMLKYRSKGGVFRYKTDLKKIYGMTEQIFEQLQPYITLPSKPATTDTTTKSKISPANPVESSTEAIAQNNAGNNMANTNEQRYSPTTFSGSKKNIENKQAPNTVLQINYATKSQWAALPGLTPQLAGQIMAFKTALGGFSSIEQVAETKNMPTDVWQKIAPLLANTNPPALQQLNLNTATTTDLEKHPYINGKTARAIVALREKYGPYTSPKSLLDFEIMPPENYQKLLPYLTVK